MTDPAVPPGGAVLLATLGSLGDLYPVLSLARALRDAGAVPRLALTPDDCAVAAEWGLDAVPVGPSRAEMSDRLGLSLDEIAASILRDPGPLVGSVLLPLLPDLVAQTEPLIRGARAVAATTFALHASLAAERAGLPFYPLALQPMLLLSALDPPRASALRLAVPRPGPLGRPWNRAVMAAARATLRRRHARDLTRIRAGLGLPPQPGTPLVDHGATVPARPALWDPAFAPIPADAPRGTVAVGFPPAPHGTLDPAVTAWLDAGPPPLVVTLGSIAHALGGPRFWDEAAALARRMGLRAVLLHGAVPAPRADRDVLALRYAPHAALFHRAAAVLHHGGIGTAAEALRAGRAQLVLPVGGDQPDNAARLVRLGVAATLPARRFTARRAEALLRPLLRRFDAPRAARLATETRARDGAARAARIVLGENPSATPGTSGPSRPSQSARP